MNSFHPKFTVRLVRSKADLYAVQRLRYDIFVGEMGAANSNCDSEPYLEADLFDQHCIHLMLLDCALGDTVDKQIVGTYRVLTEAGASRVGGFYSSSEFDLSSLLNSNRRLIELGRSCLRPAYRGGNAMYHLWQALADVIAEEGAEVLFGVASFSGTDVTELAQPLSYLSMAHMAPEPLRPRSLTVEMAPAWQLCESEIDRLTAIKATPSLIKAYLRLGGGIGEGIYIDKNFNTTDVCLILDTQKMNPRQKAIYLRK